MKTYDEVLDQISINREDDHKKLEEIHNTNLKYVGLIQEIASNPRTKEMILTGLQVILNDEGIVDPYKSAYYAFLQGIEIGMMMEREELK